MIDVYICICDCCVAVVGHAVIGSCDSFDMSVLGNTVIGPLHYAGHTYYAHLPCLCWIPQVQLTERNSISVPTLKRLLRLSTEHICNYCNGAAAMIPCAHPDCTEYYHFPCAIQAKCAFVGNYVHMFCNKHVNTCQQSDQKYESVNKQRTHIEPSAAPA